MPIFYTEDVEVEVEDFVDNCSRDEVQELIKYLGKMGHAIPVQQSQGSPLEDEHIEKSNLLASKFYTMTNEDLELFETIYNKYK